MNLAYCSLAALFITIVVSCFTEINVGILAIALTWIVGVLLGGMTVDRIASGFPFTLPHAHRRRTALHASPG